jgi:hypothetical protein
MSDSPSSSSPPPPTAPARLWRGLLLLLVVASPVVFTLCTGNIWEDFFITYRSSLNLAHGNGLVFEVGHRVHTFTSPLGTLIPAGLAWGTGTDDPGMVLALFRAIACVALGFAWWLAGPRLRAGGALALAGLLWALDVKIAAFSTNGMETALLLLAVVAAWRALLDHRPVLAGVALGAAMWVRPDGFVFVGAIAAGVWLVRGESPWRFRDWLTMAAVAAVIYTPWFAWAWSYYGSPVPNTIVAKGTHLTPASSLQLLATYPFRFLFGHSAAHDAFLPPYFFFGEWPAWIPWYGRVMALLAAGVAAWPRCPRPARVAGVAFVLGGVYLTITTRAPWYFPAWSLLAYFALAGGLTTAWHALQARPVGRWVVAGFAGLLVAAQAWLYIGVTVQLRAQQRLIEWGVRAPIGRALKNSAASPRETVFLEPLGYIGYFSNLSMRDTPGLCAPDVVKLRKSGIVSMGALIAALQPDWAVLRASEVVGMSPSEHANLERDYTLVGTHDVRKAVNEIAWLPGREFLLMDAYYTIWRRKPAPAAAP